MNRNCKHPGWMCTLVHVLPKSRCSLGYPWGIWLDTTELTPMVLGAEPCMHTRWKTTIFNCIYVLRNTYPWESTVLISSYVLPFKKEKLCYYLITSLKKIFSNGLVLQSNISPLNATENHVLCNLTMLIYHKYLSLTSQFHLLLLWFKFKAFTQRYFKREYLWDFIGCVEKRKAAV